MKRIQPTISHLDSMELDVNQLHRNPYATPGSAYTDELESDTQSGLVSEPTWFGFHGRLSGLRYWTWLVLTLFYVPAGLSLLYLQNIREPILTIGTLEYYLLVALLTFSLTFIYFSIAVRRLHDVDASGWWSLFLLVPLLSYVVVLIIGLIPGSRGDNRFGARNVAQSTLSKLVSWIVILSVLAALPYWYLHYLSSAWAFLSING